MKLSNIAKTILEENRKYSYCCSMIFFDFPNIKEIHNLINEEDIYIDENDPTFGLETEPHTTLLFGTHEDVNEQSIVNTIKSFTYYPCKLSNVSLFNNPQYDVLKFDVAGRGLHECNAALKQFPYTSNFPDYHPHLTIAYIKPGLGEKYVKMFQGTEFKLIPKKGVYSKTDGSKIDIPISIGKSL